MIIVTYTGEIKRSTRAGDWDRAYASWTNGETRYTLLRSNQEDNSDPGATWLMRKSWFDGYYPKYWIGNFEVAKLLADLHLYPSRTFDGHIWLTWNHFTHWAQGLNVTEYKIY